MPSMLQYLRGEVKIKEHKHDNRLFLEKLCQETVEEVIPIGFDSD